MDLPEDKEVREDLPEDVEAGADLPVDEKVTPWPSGEVRGDAAGRVGYGGHGLPGQAGEDGLGLRCL